MSTINCIKCGAEARRCGSQALYCMPCALAPKPRIAAPGRLRNVDMKPLRLDGRWCCVECLGPVVQGVYGGRKVRPPVRCRPCGLRRYHERKAITGRAHAEVAKAVKAGLLAHPSKLRCVDCGVPACQYDHRDYSKPLDVAPVCRSCNVMRGSADVWPAAMPVHASDPTASAT